MKYKEIDKCIAAAVIENEGYCPCAIDKNEDTKCPCRVFREETPVGCECVCGRFVKEEQ